MPEMNQMTSAANSLPLSPRGRGWRASQTSLRSLRKFDCVWESEREPGEGDLSKDKLEEAPSPGPRLWLGPPSPAKGEEEESAPRNDGVKQ